MALSMLFARNSKNRKLTPEEKAIQDGVQAPGFFAQLTGADRYSKAIQEIRYKERRDLKEKEKQSRKDFHEEERELMRTLAEKQKRIEGVPGYNIEHFRKKAQRDERFAPEVDRREELADFRYGKIERKQLEHFEERKEEHFKQLKRQTQQNIRSRINAFGSQVRTGATGPRSVTPPRAA